MKIFFLCLLFLWVAPAAETHAETPFERELQSFVGEKDTYIGRRFKTRFPSLYSRLVSICCLKDGGKVSEVRWYPRPAGGGGDYPCRAVFHSRKEKIVRVELFGPGCGR
jgi:hypothetical protein